MAIHPDPQRTRLFESFMRQHQDMVYSTAVRILGQPAQAQDLAQEVFLRAYQNFEQLHASPTAAAWLKTVARNLSLNHVTRYQRRWRFFSELASNDAEEPSDFDVPIPDTLLESMAAQQHTQLIEQALQALPAHHRVPLVLFHFEELSYEQIAQQLRISLAKVKIDLLRARAALAKAIARAAP